MEKLTFKGIIQSIQPRIRLTRSFDESSHEYLGYALFLRGQLGDESILADSGSEWYHHGCHVGCPEWTVAKKGKVM